MIKTVIRKNYQTLPFFRRNFVMKSEMTKTLFSTFFKKYQLKLRETSVHMSNDSLNDKFQKRFCLCW